MKEITKEKRQSNMAGSTEVQKKEKEIAVLPQIEK